MPGPRDGGESARGYPKEQALGVLGERSVRGALPRGQCWQWRQSSGLGRAFVCLGWSGHTQVDSTWSCAWEGYAGCVQVNQERPTWRWEGLGRVGQECLWVSRAPSHLLLPNSPLLSPIAPSRLPSELSWGWAGDSWGCNGP